MMNLVFFMVARGGRKTREKVMIGVFEISQI